MLNYFIQKAHNRKMLVHPRIVIGVPVKSRKWKNRRPVMDSACIAPKDGQPKVRTWWNSDGRLAIGAGLPITEPSGKMVVDIGGGAPSDVAVISLSGIVYSRSVRVAW